MRKPIAVKFIVGLAWFTVGIASALIAAAFVAVAVPPGDDVFRSFLAGALDAQGYDHASFKAYDSGVVAGGVGFRTAPAALVLVSLRRGGLSLLRASSVLWLFVSLGAGQPFIALVVVVLTLLRSVRLYCDGILMVREMSARGT